MAFLVPRWPGGRGTDSGATHAWHACSGVGPPERPVLLGAYHHLVAPSDGRVQVSRLTSLSSPLFTSSCQWIGIGIGVWQGFGVAVGERDVGGGVDSRGLASCLSCLNYQLLTIKIFALLK